MSLELAILEGASPADGEYDAFLDTCRRSVVQQSTVWRDVIAPLGPDEPRLLLARDGRGAAGALPLYIFRGPFGAVATSVPQPGPLGGVACADGRPDRPGVYRFLLEAAVRLAREEGCALLTVLTSPFDDDAGLCREILRPEYELENYTQVIRLAEVFPDAGEPAYLREGSWPPYGTKDKTNIRRNLSRAREAGLRVEEPEGERDFEAWYAVHRERHQGVGARPLDRELFRRILDVAAPAGRALLLLVRDGSEVAGGCFFVFNRRIADVFLMSARDEALGRGANYALTHAFLGLARERGFELLNWQSSPSRGGGVYEFKRRWGSRESPYRFLTRVTGDVAPILAAGDDEVRQGYRNHYVLPRTGPPGGRFGDGVRPSVAKA